tara:strand:+ start:215 stop:451 length:237 start_codon:yes stop_codon:yes gene_type:complete
MEHFKTKIMKKTKNKKIMDYKKIDNIEVDGIDFKDYPDFCDAYIVSADYDGVPMTDDQLDKLNEDGDYVYEHIMDYLQ